MYHLQTFGGVALLDADGSGIRLRSRKHLALLLYLVANSRRVHTRRELAGLFWATPAGRARHSLSQAVYDLRRRLDGIGLDAPGEEIRLDPRKIRYDAAELEDAVREGDLSRAVELYRGPFACNLEAAGGADFERWVESERSRLQRLAQLTLRRYVQACDAQARWGELCIAALKLVQADPLDEEAHRALMRGFWLHGDRTSALRHYEEIAEFLAAELPGGVSAETRALADRIRVALPDHIAASTTPDDRVPLIGRTTEFEALKETVRKLRSSEGGSVVVQGEAGIGKTRLIQELGRWLSLEPVRRLESRCYAAETDVAYGPVVDALGPLVDDMVERCPGEYERYTRLGNLFPVLAPCLRPELDQGVDAAAWRRRLYEELAELLRVMVARRPIVWIVEDVHWIDATSRSLLHYLSRRLADRPFLVLMTERIERGAAATGGIRRDESLLGDGAARLVLGPLSDAEIEQIVVANCPEARGHPAIDLARRLSGGNPFFALEVFRAAHASTDWIAEAGNWDPLTDARLADVFAVRFRGLSAEALRLLQAVSVLERHATPRHVSELARLTLPEAADCATELYRRGLLVDEEPGLSYSNDIVREYVYRQMSSMQTVALHLTAAELLEGRTGVGAATLARHFYLGDEKPKTFKYGMQAAEEASEAGGHLEGAALAAMALEAASGPEQTLKALRVLARAELLSAQLEAARRHYMRILELDTGMSLAERIETKLHVVETMAELCEWQAARVLLGELADEIDALPESGRQVETRAESLFWSLKVSMRLNDCDAAARIAMSAQRLREDALRSNTLTPAANIVSLCCLAAYTAFFENASKALGLIKLAEASIAYVPDPLVERVKLFSGMVRLRMADWEEGERDLRTALALAQKRQDFVQLCSLWNNLACSALEQADWHRFTDTMEKANAIHRTLPAELDVVLPLTINQATAEFYQGRVREAAALYERALEMAARAGARDFVPQLTACRGLTALQLGDWPTVTSMWQESLACDDSRLAGGQERFKFEWFRAYMHRRTNMDDAARRLLGVATAQEVLDIPSHLKLFWIGLLLFPRHAKEFAPHGEAELKQRLREHGLMWFGPIVRRWLLVTDGHVARSGGLRRACLGTHRPANGD